MVFQEVSVDFVLMVVLLSERNDRLQLRGVARIFNAAGNHWLCQLELNGPQQVFGPIFKRLEFWGPWVGHNVIRELPQDPLSVSMWEAFRAELGNPLLVDHGRPGRAFQFCMRSSAMFLYGVNWFGDSYTPELMVLRSLEGHM